MTTKAALIERLKKASLSVSRATTWESSVRRMSGAELQYMFEFACYLHLLKQFKSEYSLGLVKRVKHVKLGKKAAIACWPRAPGDKVQWSYFTLTPRSGTGRSWQLCAGTGIEDIHGQQRHPDISLQKATAPDTPCHSDVVAIWDAKFRKAAMSRISGGEVASFLMFMTQLKIASKPVPSPLKACLPGIAVRSGLITNGEFSTEKDATLAAGAVQETAGYWRASKHRP